MFLGPLTNLPFIIFSGFFVYMKDSPEMLHWLFHASYIKYGLEGMMMAVYGYDREKLACEDDYCHFKRPLFFLKELGMHNGDFWLCAEVLLALLVILRISTFIVLKWRLRHIRN